MLRDPATSRPRENLPPCYGVFLYLIGRLSDARRAPDAFHRWVNLGSSSDFICHSGILSPAEKLPVSTAVPCFRFLSSLGFREVCESGRRRMSRFSPSDINEGFRSFSREYRYLLSAILSQRDDRQRSLVRYTSPGSSGASHDRRWTDRSRKGFGIWARCG